MPTGVYGKMAIRRSKLARARRASRSSRRMARNRSNSSITTRVFAFAEGSVELTHEIDGQKIADKVVVRPGENLFVHNVTIKNPKLWWPNGQGERCSTNCGPRSTAK